jgi:hypothetical protein
MRIWLCLVLLSSIASADNEKYKRMDAARVAIIEALDKGDAKTFATYLDTSLEVTDLWFDTAACRKKFGTAKVTAKTVDAFVACIAPLHVHGRGLNVYYGPDVSVRVKIEVVDGGNKAVLRSLAGQLSYLDATLPEVWVKEFEKHRTAGDAIILDEAARSELAALGETKGVVVLICVDAKGRVKKTGTMPREAPKANQQIAAVTKSWTFEPFTARGKPIGACSTLVVKH